MARIEATGMAEKATIGNKDVLGFLSSMLFNGETLKLELVDTREGSRTSITAIVTEAITTRLETD